jgi:hypothetical protein
MMSLPKSMQMSLPTVVEKCRGSVRRGTGLWLAALLAVGLAGGLGASCYNPAILDEGFICAEAGKRCPDGFECNAANKCKAVVKCPVPPQTPICTDPQKAGTDCNPACQFGCACGRCNVANASAKCTTVVGTAMLGQLCTPNNDNCAAGLICLLEPDTCGSNVGRCYQHCTASGSAAAQCGTGRACEIPILDSLGKDTTYRTCGLAAQTCNPATNNGCPSAAFSCYLNTAGAATLCDCPNTATPVILGGVCAVYNDCAAGLVCTTSAGSVGPHCRQICTQSSSGQGNGCPSGQRCFAIGATYGYCGTG